MPTYKQDHKAMEAARVPLSHRDTCAHLLIPLNKCRRNTYFMPFSCSDQRHVYEECEYNAYLQRCEMKKQLLKKGTSE
ncbi:hypothetical protein TrRE_jg8207 [Triparma retinervis]|uniref:NADH dehydrogenase [ubiquinone] 1 beta subcomplex subunit 7 n=1 Tax=Triparma retinervis TaxID=2557542 RepID=A0A9W7DUX2_9STRA|nr:hypothetical protein TrRE_jg8207 [Triparma retinervis]